MEKQKLGWAFLLACPSCAGTLFLALAGAAGISAALFRGTLLVVALGTIAMLWGLNAYRRRNESCPLPQS